MSFIPLMSLVISVLFISFARHQNRLARIRQGNMCVFATALMLTATFVAGDESSVRLTTAIPRLQGTVFGVPEVSCLNTSCSGRCGMTSSPYNYFPCSCDMDCIIYQDCCLDFGSLCTNGTEDYHPGQTIAPPDDTPPLSCVRHETFVFNPIYMVTGCPEGYKHQRVRDLCESDASDFVLSHLPIVVGGIRFAYRNVYCAACNSVNISIVDTFKNLIVCPFFRRASEPYLEARPPHEITFSEILSAGCKLQILSVKLEGYKNRECVMVDMDTCKELGPVKDACEAFLEPITILSTELETVARNKYCLQCNDFEESNTTCWVRPKPDTGIGRPGLKFSLLFDFTAVDIPVRTPDSTYLRPAISGRKDLPERSLDRDNEYHFLELAMSINGTNALDHLGDLEPTLVNGDITWMKCVLSAAYSNSHTRNNETQYYNANATLSSFIFSVNEILALSMNLSSTSTGVRSTSGSLRNFRSKMDEVCLSPIRYYDINTFRERYELFFKRNKVLNGTSFAQFPFEVLWSVGHNDILFENCRGVSNWCTFGGGCSIPVVAVCGDTIEPGCEVTIFDNDTRGNTSVPESLTELQDSPLYQIGDAVAACKTVSRETDALHVVELYITVIGCSLSILGLTVTIGTYCSFQQLRTLAGNCVLNLVFALLTAQVLFLVGGGVAWRNKYACHAVGILQHFFWLATFSWTNILSFDLARTFSGKTAFPYRHTGNKRLVQYMVVGWGSPVIVVGTTAALDFTSSVSISYGKSDICWITNKDALLVAFVVPVTLHIIFNVIAFTFTVYNIRKIRKMADSLSALPERRNQLGVYSRISALMGFTWIIGYLSNIWAVAALRIVFSGINSLQGFFIAVAFVLTSRVIKLFKDRLFPEPPQTKKTHVHSTSTPTSNAKK